jgi:hypothetical protein
MWPASISALRSVKIGIKRRWAQMNLQKKVADGVGFFILGSLTFCCWVFYPVYICVDWFDHWLDDVLPTELTKNDME